MKYLAFFLLLVSALVLDASQKRKVLIIGIDGAKPDALKKAETPVIDSLQAAGTFSNSAWHMGITISGPSWSDIMCGVWEAKHGVTGNSYEGSNFNAYPYFVNRAKDVVPDLYAVQVVEWSALNDQVYNHGFDKSIKTACDACMDENNNTAELACEELSNPDLDCIFVYFDQVDTEGHKTGFSRSNPKYITAIEYVDQRIGVIMNCLRNRPSFDEEDWLILGATDHGGSGLGHGGGSIDERKIWLFASGNAVEVKEVVAPDPGTYEQSYKIFSGVRPADPERIANAFVHTDIAVTALHHLLADTIGDSIQPYIERWSLDGKSWLKPVNVPTLAVEYHSEVLLNIYPNPVKDVLHIELDKNLRVKGYEVTDISGKMLFHKDTIAGEWNGMIDCSDLPKGTFSVRVQFENGSGRAVFVKL